MRLYLAVALLMLAFVAYTEAQEEETVEQKFANFGRQMAEVGKNLAEKAQTTFEQAQNSEFAVTTRTWIQEQIDKVKAHFAEGSQ